jgi:hypothetical protein
MLQQGNNPIGRPRLTIPGIQQNRIMNAFFPCFGTIFKNVFSIKYTKGTEGGKK